MTERVNYLTLVWTAKAQGFEVTSPWGATYQKDMTIWNRRLQTAPAMVAFCKTRADVKLCVDWCVTNKFPLRVRSGGHHHEGMSCYWDVLIIDLSLMNTIQYVDEHTAWIPPGKKLTNVYCELGVRQKIIPGGGCETVCIGGLTLGGGWGMWSLALGLTCDNILEAEMVLADGRMVNVNADEHRDLFWAIRGGGAGNFGIVTNFKFKLTDYFFVPSTTESWTGTAAKDAMTDMLTTLRDDRLPLNTTLACRLYLDDDGAITFKKTTQLMATTMPPAGAPFQQGGMPHFADSKLSHHPSFATAGTTPSTPSSKPADTCLTGPLPHKVSSAFAKNDHLIEAGNICYEFLQRNPQTFANAETYISFHSFGGAISNVGPGDTAFPFRDRKLLFQFQAWWSDPGDEDTDQYIAWIRNIRMTLARQNVTDGGFVNFQDASIVEDDKHALMSYYYKDNLNRLIDIKHAYDPNNLFDYGMSVPMQ